jgi:hypothetical protein
MMRCDENTPSRHLVDFYRQSFTRIHHRPPYCRYLGNKWFDVNGEMVHRSMLIEEIERLCDLYESTPEYLRNVHTTDKSVITRLIARLRRL